MRTRSTLGLLLICGCAHAEQVVLHALITNFAPDALGGIRTIIRYAVPRPDRSETAYLLLGDASSDPADASPVAIQIQGPHGDPTTLSDVEGADCTLARTAIFRTGKKPSWSASVGWASAHHLGCRARILPDVCHLDDGRRLPSSSGIQPQLMAFLTIPVEG